MTDPAAWIRDLGDLSTGALAIIVLGYLLWSEINKRKDVRRLRANGAGDVPHPASGSPQLVAVEHQTIEIKALSARLERALTAIDAFAAMGPSAQRGLELLRATSVDARAAAESASKLAEEALGAQARDPRTGAYRWYGDPTLSANVQTMAAEVHELAETLRGKPCLYLDQPSRGLPERGPAGADR